MASAPDPTSPYAARSRAWAGGIPCVAGQGTVLDELRTDGIRVTLVDHAPGLVRTCCLLLLGLACSARPAVTGDRRPAGELRFDAAAVDRAVDPCVDFYD